MTKATAAETTRQDAAHLPAPSATPEPTPAVTDVAGDPLAEMGNGFDPESDFVAPEEQMTDPFPAEGEYDDDPASAPRYRYLASLPAWRSFTTLEWGNTFATERDFVHRSLASRGLTLWKRGDRYSFVVIPKEQLNEPVGTARVNGVYTFATEDKRLPHYDRIEIRVYAHDPLEAAQMVES